MSATTTHPQALRPLAPSELRCSSRHHLGLYRCVVVTCRYQLPSSLPRPLPDASHPIFPALAQVVSAHPMLRVGILGEDTSKAAFSYIPRVDLAQQVEFRSIPDGDQYEQRLAEVQAWYHDQRFQDLERRPPWRLVVVSPDPPGTAGFEDFAFAFHHSLMDGTSGRLFHEHLLRALNAPGAAPHPSAHVLDFPTAPTLPEPPEDVIPWRSSYAFFIKTLWNEFGPGFLTSAKPPLWAGPPVDFAHPHETRVTPVDMPAAVVASLLTACRAHGSSITSLLHALCLASLAVRAPIPPGVALESATPIALRPYLSPTANPVTRDTLRNLVSGIHHIHPASAVAAFREPRADVDELIWTHAQRIKNALRERTRTLPADDRTSLAKYISDWFGYWAKQDRTPRETAWEMSNVGIIDVAPAAAAAAAAEESRSEWTITRGLFTNGVMVVGAMVGCSVVSVPGGALTVGISWNRGVVEDELVEGLAEDLRAYTTRLHETGKFRAPFRRSSV